MFIGNDPLLHFVAHTLTVFLLLFRRSGWPIQLLTPDLGMLGNSLATFMSACRTAEYIPNPYTSLSKNVSSCFLCQVEVSVNEVAH